MKSRPVYKKKPGSDISSLPRVLSKLGYCSRSQAAGLVTSGKVRVNGEEELDPRRRVSIVRDRISVEGSVLEKKRPFVYLCMNKPRGIVTTRSDERGAATVYSLLGNQPSWIFPVGRLDKESTGLLLFTNDADFADELTRPGAGHPKFYRVCVDKTLADDDLQKLRSGIVLSDGTATLPAQVRRLNGEAGKNSFTISITEGKNRQIRRMCRALGYHVVDLHRFRIGRLSADGLAPGEWRALTEEEKMRALGR